MRRHWCGPQMPKAGASRMGQFQPSWVTLGKGSGTADRALSKLLTRCAEFPGWWTHGRAEKVTCLGRGWKIYTPSPYSMPCASLPLDFLNCIFYHKLMTTGKLLSCVLWVMPVNYGDRGRDCGKFWICRQSGRSVGCLGPSLWLLSEMGTVSRDWVLTLWGLCKLRVVSVIKIELNCQAIGWYHKAGNWL